MRAQELVESLGLEPHPEGGFFRRIYTSPHAHHTPGGERPTATSIHYLMTDARPCGRLHRNRSDILHFFLEGDPVEYHVLDAEGRHRVHLLGPDTPGRLLTVPGGRWKASRLPPGSRYTLVAEVVTPGFDFADHEFATEHDLPPARLGLFRRFLG
ncbi:cupin domain-containing protein [Streptacidiphilus rugosus]|uniref:cupin domain-containing protein n=1 Tax=Streptacidiphilus rugosus TaxID=405783 RepID=UPI00068F86D6|nr:cupin domain-containing protein [Streptacidiphilus rugosus]